MTRSLPLDCTVEQAKDRGLAFHGTPVLQSVKGRKELDPSWPLKNSDNSVVRRRERVSGESFWSTVEGSRTMFPCVLYLFHFHVSYTYL